MKYAYLGSTGIKVSELCIGTLIHGKLQADLPPIEGAMAIRRAIDMGVNFIDTAKGYQTYPHVEIATRNLTDIVIASKSPVKTETEMYNDVVDSLRMLGRDVVDIFHLHLVRSADDMREREGALHALVRCKEEGLIRAIGVSVHGIDGLNAALTYNEVEVMLPIVNRKGLGITDGTLDGMIDITRDAHNRGLGVYDMKPLAGGHFIDDIPASIQYVRDLNLFDSIAVGLKTIEEVDTMIGIFEGNAECIEHALHMGRSRAKQKRLIVYDTCEKCGACVNACAQGAMSIGPEKAQVDMSACILCGYCASSCPKFAIRVV